MKVDIYIREQSGNREIRIPWLPEQIKFKSGGTTMATYDIADRGEVAVPTGSGLTAISWESEFPGKYRTDKSMLRGKWKEPKHYHNILQDWKAKGTPLHLLVVGYPINMDVYLEDYTGSAESGFGDIVYELSFIEDRNITVSTTKVAEAKRQTKKTSTKNSKKTYTIKSGDTLWAIARKHYGSGSKWQTIYKANKTIIEKTAKKRGKKSSSNGHWIYPGTILTIP